MANHRPYTEREKVLDQCLSDGVGYTCKQLMAYCNAKAEERGYKPINSKTTLLTDLYNIESSYHIVIDKETRGREIYYNSVGKVYSGMEGILSSWLAILQPCREVLPRFFFYLMKGHERLFMTMTKGAATLQLDLDALRK